MSETPWTKGPWEIIHHSWKVTGIYGEQDWPVASLDMGEVNEDRQEDEAKVMEANARLIAAAPCMAEALHRLIQGLGLDSDEDATEAAAALGCEDPSNVIEVSAMARAALAKARGEL